MPAPSATTPRAHPAALTLAIACLLCILVPAIPAQAAASDSIQKELDRVAGEYGRLESRLAETETRQAQLDREQQEARQIIAERSRALQARAGQLYKSGGVSTLLGQLLTSGDFGEFTRRIHYMGVLGSSDAALVEELTIAHARNNELAEQLAAEQRRQAQVVDDLGAQRRQLERRYEQARQAEEERRRAAQAQLRNQQQLSAQRRQQLETTAQGTPPVTSSGRFARFTLPLSPSGFANTWGAPRSGGRRHQGTDVMAACGAPVYAVTDGTIQRLLSGGNGGIMLYLRAGNGDVFFYAHLQSYASGITTGARVSAGQVIAANGRTGNARGGPCHVHFEWHPSGGRPVNPYPLLNSAR